MSIAAITTAGPDLAARRPLRSWRLYTISGVIVVLLLGPPLAFLIIQAAQAGSANIASEVVRPLTVRLLWNTLSLTAVVTALCAVIGTATAWCVERTTLPGRSVFAILLVIPFAVPDFVMGYGWATLTPSIQGFVGAALIMTLTLFPLVFLPVSASLRASDPAQEAVARGLGVGRMRTFRRVTLGQIRGGLVGGCLLVALILLAEYGAFELLTFQSFTTEIYAEFQVSFNLPSAAVLSLILVAISIVVLSAGSVAQGHRYVARGGALAQRSTRPHRLGLATIPVLSAHLLLVALSLGVPIGASVYWMLQGGFAGIAGDSIWAAAGTTVLYCGIAAAIATAAAVPVAVLSLRHRGRLSALMERSTYLILAMPGFVVAFAISYFAERDAGGVLYQSSPMVVLAYAILFFPLALVGVRASIAHAPAGFEEAAQSVGMGRLSVLLRVTLPTIGPGLAAAFCLVFLAAETELTATLVLAPIGVQTLSTQFWAFETNLEYAQAAPFALANMAVAVIPCIILGRHFDRASRRSRVAR